MTTTGICAYISRGNEYRFHVFCGSNQHLLRPGRQPQRVQTVGMERMPLRGSRTGRLAGADHPTATEHPS
jgi:hypothetical protein